MGRSRRRPRLAEWFEEAANSRDHAAYGVWENATVAARFAAALIFPATAAPIAGCLRPAVVVLSGLPGVGKTHLARELTTHAPVTVISADRVRRILVAFPGYSDREHQFIHDVCLHLARHGLATQRTVIVDATNLRHQYRQRFRDVAQQHHAPCHLVHVDCQEATVRRRLQQRARGEAVDGSDADESVYELLQKVAEPFQEPHLRLRGDGDVSDAARAVLGLLRPPAAAALSYRPVTWETGTLAGAQL